MSSSSNRRRRPPSSSVPPLTSAPYGSSEGTGSNITPPRPQGIASPTAGTAQEYPPQLPGAQRDYQPRTFTASELDRSSSIRTPPGVAQGGPAGGPPSVSPSFQTQGGGRRPLSRSDAVPPNWSSMPSGGSQGGQRLRLQPQPTDRDVLNTLRNTSGLAARVERSYEGGFDAFKRLNPADKAAVLRQFGVEVSSSEAAMPSSPPTMARPTTADSVASAASRSTTDGDIERALLASPSVQKKIEKDFGSVKQSSSSRKGKGKSKVATGGLEAFKALSIEERQSYLSQQGVPVVATGPPVEEDDDDEEEGGSGSGSGEAASSGDEPASGEEQQDSSSDDGGPPTSPLAQYSTRVGQPIFSNWSTTSYSRGGGNAGGSSNRGGYSRK